MTTEHLSETFDIMERYITFGKVRKDIKLDILQEVCAKYNQQVVAFEIDDDGVEWHELSPGIPINNERDQKALNHMRQGFELRYGIDACISLPLND